MGVVEPGEVYPSRLMIMIFQVDKKFEEGRVKISVSYQRTWIATLAPR